MEQKSLIKDNVTVLSVLKFFQLFQPILLLFSAQKTDSCFFVKICFQSDVLSRLRYRTRRGNSQINFLEEEISNVLWLVHCLIYQAQIRNTDIFRAKYIQCCGLRSTHYSTNVLRAKHMKINYLFKYLTIFIKNIQQTNSFG